MFKDLDELLDDTLALPVNGKVYRIPAADAELGIWCQRVIAAGLTVANGGEVAGKAPGLTLDDDDEVALYRRLLGGVWDELAADCVSWPKISFVAQTALFWAALGREQAERFWNSGGDPKASAPRAARRQAAKAATSTNTDAASTTRRRASTNGTKSRATPTKTSTRRA